MLTRKDFIKTAGLLSAGLFINKENTFAYNFTVYQNTRRMLLSSQNPFFFKGKSAEGVGSPHTGLGQIWPIGIIIRALTSSNDPQKYTRKWFAWGNTIFGELIMDIYHSKPILLNI